MNNNIKYSAKCKLFADMWRGDTMRKRNVQIEGVDLTGYDIAIDILNSFGQKVKSLKIGDGIDASDISEGVFNIEEWQAAFTPGNYRFDVQFTSPEGLRRTWLYGEFRVYNDVTK